MAAGLQRCLVRLGPQVGDPAMLTPLTPAGALLLAAAVSAPALPVPLSNLNGVTPRQAQRCPSPPRRAGVAMATASAMAAEPPPLARAGTGTATVSSPRIAPPRSRRAVGCVRASPASTSGSAPDEPAVPLLSNARRRGRDPLWRGGGFSLGVDLGGARTGLAVGRGITLPRPLTVLKLRGQKLEMLLLDMAEQQEADELIVGLPVSAHGSETPQSNKVRSVVGRLAVQAAQRGLRVYLQDEYGTSTDALDFMISRGVKKYARDVSSDAYAAVMILKRYFSSSGQEAEIVLPRQPELQDKLISRSRRDVDI